MSKYTTLYQHGTLALLVPGLLDGTITMGDLLKKKAILGSVPAKG